MTGMTGMTEKPSHRKAGMTGKVGSLSRINAHGVGKNGELAAPIIRVRGFFPSSRIGITIEAKIILCHNGRYTDALQKTKRKIDPVLPASS